MFGHGGPIKTRRLYSTRTALPLRARLACALVVLLSTTAQAQSSLQLRIAWGGGAPQQWFGTVALTEGRIFLHRPLGIEADEPGSIWVDENRLEIRQKSPREYDGVDVFVEAPLEAKLLFSITADPRQAPVTQELRLADLIQKPFSRPLDDRNNRLLVRRAPGDMLRVRLPRNSLVVACDERVSIDVKPHLLPVAAGTSVRIKTRLVAKTGGDELWSQINDVTRSAGDDTSPAEVSLELSMPAAEGVYNLILEASEQRNPLRWNKPIATRHVQFMVVSDQPAPSEPDRTPWTKVFEIDPANPGWSDRLKNLSRMPGWRHQGPLGNGHAQTRQHALGPVVQLGPAASAEDLAWEAYPLEIETPGVPHLLEVEFPSDVAQTLGISILEPNSAGHITPIGLDSGVYTSASTQSSSPEWHRHRLIFWPRTKSPLVLMTNRAPGDSAAYGKIRVLAGPARLPPAFQTPFDRSERLFGACFHRPLFNENFGAVESLDSWSGRSLDDWQTFYEGATRLVDYLNHTGYNALMLTVLADGSTIYPSDLLQPTPRYDTGPFFDSGQDPFRKDGLELLLRVFDREGGKLIPAIQFSAPLPALEEFARRTDSQTSGILLIGADGRPWTASHLPQNGLAPYYNPLNPHVQEAMLAVVREIVLRYGHHPAFAGLAIQLSAHGYAQLPGEAWGFDDATIAAFERDKRVRVPGAGIERFAERARHLLGAERKTWLQWRAEKLADFHFRLQRELVNVRSDALFCLAPTDMFDTPEARREMFPGLSNRGRIDRIDEVLLTLGIRPALYRDHQGLVFLRPERITPPAPVAAHAQDAQLARSAELDRLARESFLAGSLFWHEPPQLRLSSFEAKSPFGQDKTYAWLVAQMSPAGPEDRQRFVRSLARIDSEVIFDGGWLLPLGQEGALAPIVATFRRLPAGKFESLAQDEPVTIRGLVRDGISYFYFVNDSAWPVTVSMEVQSPPGVRTNELSGLRRLPPIQNNRWELELEAFDLIAVRFASPDAKLTKFVVSPSEAVHPELQRRIDELGRRLAVLESRPQLAGPKNPGFEVSARGQPANWTLTTAPPASAAAQVERRQGFQGTNAVRLQSSGHSSSLFSEPFSAPKTGRLSLSVRLRVENADEQPSLRLSVEGTHNGATYNPFAMVGGGAGAVPIPGDWAASQFILKIEDVPADNLSDLRVRFDLVGPGAVWIDDVQLYHLEFSDNERFELARRLGLAAYQLERGRWGECQRELDGYWPRFLSANVPLVRQSQTAGAAAGSAGEKQATRPRAIERVKDWWKR
jgi:hypothetical protein